MICFKCVSNEILNWRFIRLIKAIPTVASNGEPLLSFANFTSGDQYCPEGYSLVGSQCLIFVTFAEENHREAKQTCHSLSGELLAITTPTQFVHVVNHIYDYGEDLCYCKSCDYFAPVCTIGF